MPNNSAEADRLEQIADEVRDGWIRCRGPLTGMKALAAARIEAATLGAGEDYLKLMDEICGAAKALTTGQSTGPFKDATRILERAIPELRDVAHHAEA